MEGLFSLPKKESNMLKLNNTTYRTPEGEIVKADGTGEVIGYEADRRPEWRAFNDEEKTKRERVGAPLTPTLHDNGLPTMIDYYDRDGSGNKLDPQQKTQAYILRKTQRRNKISDRRERTLAIGLSEISKISNKLSLPKNVLETASVIYRKAVKEKVTHRRPIQRVSAASTYVGCRQCGISRSLEDIAKAFDVNEKEAGRDYRFLVKEFDLFIPPPKPDQYVSKILNQFPMNSKSEEIAYKILAALKECRLISGRGRGGIDAAACYIGSVLGGERKTQKDIAKIAQVTDVTIRNRYKEMMDRLQIIIEL